MDQHDHSPKQQTHKPRFNITDPSIVRAQFAANRDASFSSYLHHHNHHHKNHDDEHQSPDQNKTEDSDQISIFDAAKYFSGLHDDDHHHHHRASPMTRLSSVSSIDTKSNYRARSFHATPTTSSEASWNSQVGLLTNPPGSLGISIKNISPNITTTNNTDSTNTLKWPRISPKWLIPGRKCPCSGKKSVQVEERIDVKTPKMVDLRRSTSSNGTNASSYYFTRQNSLKKSGSIVPQEPTNGNFGLNPMSRKFDHIINNNNNNKPNGFLSVSSNPKVVGPMNHANGTTTSSVSTNSFNKDVVISTSGTTTTTTTTSNGFTFPILEDQPVGVKKMFNVISEDNQQDPYRDSLEVFQPRLNHPSPRSRRASYEEENGSDGSSDLFEIESFSTTTYPHRDSVEEASANYNASIKRFGIGMVCTSNDLVIKTPSPLQLCRNSVDDNYEPMTPSVAPTECYAPSEVSIDWSVTTAEGFDRASLTNFSVSTSEIGYVAMRRELEKNGGGGGGGGRKNNGSGNGGGGGGLLSCRCEKAVSVGPVPIKCQVAGGPPIPARHVGGRHCGGKVPV